MRTLVFSLVINLTACAGDAPSNQGGACTGAAFDPCSTEHDCTSANCKTFMADGFQVCTQACSAQAPCPNDASGSPATCNDMGLCKPARANDCSR